MRPFTSYDDINFHLLVCVSVCSGPEVPVLDYQTQQLQLFPLIAAAYALPWLGRLYRANMSPPRQR